MKHKEECYKRYLYLLCVKSNYAQNKNKIVHGCGREGWNKG